MRLSHPRRPRLHEFREGEPSGSPSTFPRPYGACLPQTGTRSPKHGYSSGPQLVSLRTHTRFVSGWSKKLNATLSVDLLCLGQIQVSKRNLAGLPLGKDSQRLPDNSVVLNLHAMTITEDQHGRRWCFRYVDDLCLLLRLLFLPERFYFFSKPLNLDPKLRIGFVLYRRGRLLCWVSRRSVSPEDW